MGIKTKDQECIASRKARIVFITGTDTGAGKTLLTCLGLHHLRRLGQSALGIKPFCSGPRSDAHKIRWQSAQHLSLDATNPWHFTASLAPGAMPQSMHVPMEAVLDHLEAMRRHCDILVVEGAGGLMSPLGTHYHFGDIIRQYQEAVIIVAPNRLGVLNQILLNHSYLNSFIPRARLHFVLMGVKNPDSSAECNGALLHKWLPGSSITEIPYLGPGAKDRRAVQRKSVELRVPLECIFQA